MSDSKFLDQRTILVTGAGSGIGRAIAVAMARRGGHLFCAGRNEAHLKETQHLIAEAAGHCEILTGDVRYASDVEKIMARIDAAGRGLDVLVNNAGVYRTGKLHEMDADEFDEVLDTNVRSVWLVTRHALPLMQGRSGANIINISSIAGTRFDPGMGAFEASKAAVNTFTKVQAKELAPIRVNAIAPGPTDTKGLFEPLATDKDREEARQSMQQMVPFGRLGAPEEVARLAIFLASPEADFISGSITSIDGGMGY
ncbi:MAG: SDR family NAD(P)-dependent oxidoreductase [Sumerlaeia bacterium]